MAVTAAHDFLFAKGIEDTGSGSVVLPPRDGDKRAAGGSGRYMR